MPSKMESKMQSKNSVSLRKLQQDLLEVCLKTGKKGFEEVRGYAYKFKKYDDLTFREIDAVVAELNK